MPHSDRYTSTAALEDLGSMYLDAAKLLSHYYMIYHDELHLAALGKSADGEVKGLEALERTSLDGKVVKPLGISHDSSFLLDRPWMIVSICACYNRHKYNTNIHRQVFICALNTCQCQVPSHSDAVL